MSEERAVAFGLRDEVLRQVMRPAPVPTVKPFPEPAAMPKSPQSRGPALQERA